MKRSIQFLTMFLSYISTSNGFTAPPTVSNVQASQRQDVSRVVDIHYDVADLDSTQLVITVTASDDDGLSYNIKPVSLFGDVGVVTPGTGKHIIWDASRDIPGVYCENYRVAVTAKDDNISIIIPLSGLPQGAKPLEMVFIEPGNFIIGSPTTEIGRLADETPQHQVTLTKGYFIGKYEVTQAQWQVVMGSNPSRWIGNNLPVEKVTWDLSQSFIQKLNEMNLGYIFRLPTEAEWEYACRAGTNTRFYWGEDINNSLIEQFAWYGSNSSSKTHEVGLKLPNSWNLFDMSGNVWEWCQDWYGEYTTEDQVDPIGPASGSYHVLRSGCWYDESWRVRSALRNQGSLYSTWYNIGMRIAAIQK